MMTTPSTSVHPTPERIFQVLNAYQQSAALRAGIDLDLFTAIAEGADRPAALAKRTGASERGVRILCDFLTIVGLLTKTDGRYGLAQDAALFLDRRSPASLAAMANFIGTGQQARNFASLTESVRKGGTSVAQGDNTKPNDELWVSFARSMAGLAAPSASFIADLVAGGSKEPRKVLDIAAGHGMYGITLARRFPNVEITAVDWPPILEVAKENAKAAGVDRRFRMRAGSAFEIDLGSGYDLALLTNILHHFDPPTCEKLLRRIHGALEPGGRAVTLEFVPNEDRTTPPLAAAFALTMLAATDAGDAYTFPELERMFRNAGFAKTTLHDVPGMPQRVLVSERS